MFTNVTCVLSLCVSREILAGQGQEVHASQMMPSHAIADPNHNCAFHIRLLLAGACGNEVEF